MPGVNKKPTSKSFNAVTLHRRSARRLCTSAPRPTGSCYGTKPTRGTLDLHHSKYNDTKLTRKSVTYVVELKCYPCEWRALPSSPPPFAALTGHDAAIAEAARLTDERPELDESVKQEISHLFAGSCIARWHSHESTSSPAYLLKNVKKTLKKRQKM